MSSPTQSPEVEKSGFHLSTFWRELSTFGIIGVINAVLNIVLYYLFIHGFLEGKHTTASFLAGAIATVFAWIGNRYWTFRDRASRPVHHEVILFFVVNGIAQAFSSGYVAFAQYILNAHSDFWVLFHYIISIGIGTVIRFICYRNFVFGKDAEDPTA